MQEEELRKPSQEEHSALKKHSGTAAVRTGVAGRRNSHFDGRRVENVTDTRTPAGEANRGGRTAAPCPLGAVQTSLEEPAPASSKRGVLAIGFRWHCFQRWLYVVNTLILTSSTRKNLRL